MAGLPVIDPDKLLRRTDTAQALQAMGFPCRQERPRHHAVADRHSSVSAEYRSTDGATTLAWANEKLTLPHPSVAGVLTT